MTTPATWTHDAADDAYTLVHDGVYYCRVWRTRLGTWAAVIRRGGMDDATYDCPTPEEAMAWCEKQVGLQ